MAVRYGLADRLRKLPGGRMQQWLRGSAGESIVDLSTPVLAATNAHEAVAVALAHPHAIHLLLTDVILPGASGRDAARQVVSMRPSIRLLYMSGYTDDASVHHGVLEPGLAFIQKPFSGDTLARRIRDVLAADSPPPF